MIARVLCPAKINTFLAVGPKDSRNYHPLRTIFQAVSLFDELHLSEAEHDSFHCDDPDVPESNTVTRAISLLREFGDVPRLKVKLFKQIPLESGLGGASSNAAGLLRAVNHFAHVPFSAEILKEVALAVGADVPFFLVGGRAQAEGYGEKLAPLPDPEPRTLILLKPEVSCSTKSAYARLDESTYEWRDFPSDLGEQYNDFERVMPCECDDWMEHLQLLGAETVGLSGSGSAVFGFFPGDETAERAMEDLRSRRGQRAWKVQTLSRKDSLSVEFEPFSAKT